MLLGQYIRDAAKGYLQPRQVTQGVTSANPAVSRLNRSGSAADAELVQTAGLWSAWGPDTSLEIVQTGGLMADAIRAETPLQAEQTAGLWDSTDNDPRVTLTQSGGLFT